jgi:hypothetical protein
VDRVEGKIEEPGYMAMALDEINRFAPEGVGGVV